MAAQAHHPATSLTRFDQLSLRMLLSFVLQKTELGDAVTRDTTSHGSRISLMHLSSQESQERSTAPKSQILTRPSFEAEMRDVPQTAMHVTASEWAKAVAWGV